MTEACCLVSDIPLHGVGFYDELYTSLMEWACRSYNKTKAIEYHNYTTYIARILKIELKNERLRTPKIQGLVNGIVTACTQRFHHVRSKAQPWNLSSENCCFYEGAQHSAERLPRYCSGFSTAREKSRRSWPGAQPLSSQFCYHGLGQPSVPVAMPTPPRSYVELVAWNDHQFSICGTRDVKRWYWMFLENIRPQLLLSKKYMLHNENELTADKSHADNISPAAAIVIPLIWNAVLDDIHQELSREIVEAYIRIKSRVGERHRSH